MNSYTLNDMLPMQLPPEKCNQSPYLTLAFCTFVPTTSCLAIRFPTTGALAAQPTILSRSGTPSEIRTVWRQV